MRKIKNLDLMLNNNEITINEVSDWTKITDERLNEIINTRLVNRRELSKISRALNIRKEDILVDYFFRQQFL
ncbi:MAG: helix-turn-helix domain-containing protein [Erysipelotrichales bacterium]|nr:helix-turn-helix domain-containing protein [Erysipelotrichales bacterium]